MTTHGGTGSRLFRIWSAIKYRCYATNCKAYPRYGGRGITVCDEWLNDFAAFRQWARSNGYAAELSIDRINNDGNYEPSNCRWATRAVQGRNTSLARVVEAFGERKCLAEWEEDERCNCTWPALKYRLDAGWDAETAITTPPQKKQKPQMVTCACGCGQMLPAVDKNYRTRTFIHGHNRRKS